MIGVGQQVNDEFDIFLDTAREIETRTIARHPQLLNMLKRLHRCLLASYATPLNGPEIPSLMVVNAHVYILAAIRTALGGQLPPVYPNLRAAIESVLYGLLMSQDASKVNVWIRRHESKTAQNKCAKLFSGRQGLTVLKKHDPDAAEALEARYESSITYGAHPNHTGLFPHLDFKDDGDNWKIIVRCSYSPDSLAVFDSIVAIVETCCLVLAVARHIYPDHATAVSNADESAKIWKELQSLKETVQFSRLDA